jgi:hypothetical protein
LAEFRGEGLHPKIRTLLERSVSSPSSEVSVRHDGLIQAGSNPKSEVVSSRTNVTSFSRELASSVAAAQTGDTQSIDGKSEMTAYRLALYAVLSNLKHGNFLRFGTGIVIGAFILAASATTSTALAQSRNLIPFGVGYLEATTFIDGALHAARQDDATASIQQKPSIFGMETEPTAGEAAAKWRAVEAHFDEEQSLLEAGLSHDDVKIVILRNLLPTEDHAVAAARVDGKWLILDNRRLALVRDTEMVGSIPKFVLDGRYTAVHLRSNWEGAGRWPIERGPFRRARFTSVGLDTILQARPANGLASTLYSVSAFCGGARSASSGASATSHPPPRAR